MTCGPTTLMSQFCVFVLSLVLLTPVYSYDYGAGHYPDSVDRSHVRQICR